MNDMTVMPAQRQSTEIAPIDKLKTNLASRSDEFKMVLPAHISVDKFQRTVATAAISNPRLLECDRQSLLLAALKLAQDGLIPDGREAALVPFKTRVKGNDGQFYDKWLVQPMPMVYGLRKKVLQSGEVLSLQVGVVYRTEVQNGNFIYEIGIEPPIRHRPKLDITDEEMADSELIAAYSIAKIKNGDGEPIWSVEVMRRAEVMKVRQMSQTGALGQVVKFGPNKGKPIEPKGPWVEWEPEMWKKTALRRHSKVLPMSGDVLDLITRDIDEERAAESAAAFLSVTPDEPVRLPSPDELGGEAETHDPATGEVIEQTATGMTEVDEEAARSLDSGDADQDEGDAPETAESEPTRPEADFSGPNKPDGAKPGQSWFNPEDGKLRYAHATQHGMKWYLQPPQQDEAPKQEAAAQQAAASDPAPDQASAPNDPFHGEAFAEKRREIIDLLHSAETRDQVKFAENMLTRFYVSFPEKVQQEIEDKVAEAKDRISG